MNTVSPSSKFNADNRAQIKRHILMAGVSDPVAVSYLVRQVEHMCKMSFYDGVIAQIDHDIDKAQQIVKSRKRGKK